MAVPGRQIDVDEEEVEGLFEEEGLMIEPETDTPPHLLQLSDAAQSGNVDSLRHALDNLNGSIDEPLEDGDSALHLTCLYGHLPCVQLLLERGASLEVTDEDGAIPLHDACASGFTEIVQLLINSANPECLKRMLNFVDAEGDTPLHHAARGGHSAVIMLLLASGASITKRNLFGKTPGELVDMNAEARQMLYASGGFVECSRYHQPS